MAEKLVLIIQTRESSIMERHRYNSRIIIHDGVYDKIQEQRYLKHVESLQKLRCMDRKSNSQYLLKSNLVQQLNRSKHAKEEVHRLMAPFDTQFKNCRKRVQKIQKTPALPKISNTKLYENRRVKKMEESRILKQNKILKEKVVHLSLQKQKNKLQLFRSIKKYEEWKRLSSRHKENNVTVLK